MSTASAQPVERSDRPERTSLPSRFGRYVLVEHLATGGMADLYRALAPGAAGVSKSICIKRIRDQRLEDPRLVALFIDEARISMQLSHPNIVHTFDFGRVGDEYFLALELVEGVDLGALIDASSDKAGRLSAEEVAAVGEAICRALAHVHSRLRADGKPLGLVHRDVTPGNVLVTREGDVKLADFGVARLRANAREGLRGTIAYMAPEQANRDLVDARTDVFGLGLVLLECLRGHTAYSGERDQMLQQAQRGVVDLERTGHEPPLEVALLDVIARATARAADERYPDAAAMAEDLGRIVAQARAGGAADPRALLARRAAGSARAPLPVFTSEVPVTADRRRSVSFALDGEAPDFAQRLAGTELSQASTDAGTTSESASSRPKPRRARWIGGAAFAGVAIGTALALVWPTGGESKGARAREPQIGQRGSASSVGPRGSVSDVGSRSSGSVSDVGRRGSVSESDVAPRPSAPASESESGSGSASTARPHPGQLSLNAVPWADVSVDGVPRGTTPVRGINLSPGRHRVRLVNPPLEVDRTLIVTIRSGQERTMVVNLREDGTNVASPGEGTPP